MRKEECLGGGVRRVPEAVDEEATAGDELVARHDCPAKERRCHVAGRVERVTVRRRRRHRRQAAPSGRAPVPAPPSSRPGGRAPVPAPPPQGS